VFAKQGSKEDIWS